MVRDQTNDRQQALIMGALTALAILADLLCKTEMVNRDVLLERLMAAQESAKDERRLSLAAVQLLLELLD